MANSPRQGTDEEGDDGEKKQLSTCLLDIEARATPAGQEKQEKNIKMWVGAYGGVEDQSTWVRVRPSTKWLQWAEFAFNPVVSITSLILILGFVAWAMVRPSEASTEFALWKSWVGQNFTWFYVGAQNGWMVFVVVIYFSKYGSIRLGLRTADQSTMI